MCCALSQPISLSTAGYLIVVYHHAERGAVRLDNQLISPLLKFPTYYGTRSFIAVSLVPVVRQINPVHDRSIS
jgi:hypothetical protein